MAGTAATQTDKLRAQRDRFIAFAFAGAEVLLELDANGTIVYCAGTTPHLFGLLSEDMVGHPVTDFVAGSDRTMMDEVLRRVHETGRLSRMHLHFDAAPGHPFRGILSAIALSEDQAPTRIYVTISRVHSSHARQEEAGATPAADDSPSPEAFAQLAERRLKEAAQFGEDYQMTLIELDETALSERLEPEEATRFVDGVESYLRAWSVDGSSVGVLENGKYGVIHEEGLDSAEVSARISDIASSLDPTGQGLDVSATTIDLDHDTLTHEDISKALVYTINRFVAEGGEDFAVRSLHDGYSAAVEETLAKVNAFRQTLSSDALTLVFQPIVDLRAWSVHHYEALARMYRGNKLILPAHFIGFAEEFGVVNELDLLIVRKAIQHLRENKGLRPRAEIAVNLSGRSLSSEAFVQQLLLLLLENRDVLDRMMFELTESAELKDLESANKVIQKLRSYGCQVSIDDFGAGAAAFQYLKALQVDFVKIDGSYIRDAFATSYGRPFLKAIARLAQDMGIRSIGEMVEDSRTMWLLRDVGVEFGQGYFFGKPALDVSQFVLDQRPEDPTPSCAD